MTRMFLVCSAGKSDFAAFLNSQVSFGVTMCVRVDNVLAPNTGRHWRWCAAGSVADAFISESERVGLGSGATRSWPAVCCCWPVVDGRRCCEPRRQRANGSWPWRSRRSRSSWSCANDGRRWWCAAASHARHWSVACANDERRAVVELWRWRRWPWSRSGAHERRCASDRVAAHACAEQRAAGARLDRRSS